ncbi:DNA primase, partial [Oligoflexia bacterium]|nr:DNA primase [Oligoflexia bacterium]
MIAQDTIDAIREQANILEVVGDLVALKRQGSAYAGLCPFHSEKTPSFVVRDDDNYFHCFGCGESGNVITFVMKSQGLSFPEAVEQIAARYGIEVKMEGRPHDPKKAEDKSAYYKINHYAQHYYTESLKNCPAEVGQYLKERGFSKNCFKKFGIGFAPKGWSGLVNFLVSKKVPEAAILASGLVRRSAKGELYDLFRGRLMFPIFVERERIAGFGGRVIPALLSAEEQKSSPKYINSPETAVYHKNKILYGLPQSLQNIRQSGETLLVEGYMDVISLHRVGMGNVLATCGTAVTDKHIERLSKLTKRVLILFDGDQAGRKAAAKSFQLFINSGLDATAVFFPEGQDPDNIANAQGENARTHIDSLERVSLLCAHIEALVAQYGVSKVRELGAASKGRLCETLAKTLVTVENRIELSELAQEAAFKLLIESEQLLSQIEQLRSGQAKRSTFLVQEPPSEEDPLSGFASIVKVDELPKVDQELLLAVMAKRGCYINEILSDADLCLGLHPTARMFIEGIKEVLDTDNGDEGQMKVKITALLKNFGGSWLQYWKKAHKMKDHPDVDFDAAFSQCRTALKKQQLKTSLRDLDQQIRACDEEPQKHALIKKKVSLE